MRYRNEKTGAVIETTCIVSGGDWKAVPAENSGKTNSGKEPSQDGEPSEGKSGPAEKAAKTTARATAKGKTK